MNLYTNTVSNLYTDLKKDLVKLEQEIFNSPNSSTDSSILLAIQKRELLAKLDVIASLDILFKDIYELEHTGSRIRKIKNKALASLVFE